MPGKCALRPRTWRAGRRGKENLAMKAAVIETHGGAEVIRVRDVPRPKAERGEVVLAVRAAAMNHLDVWVRTSERFALDFPHVIGSDAAGVVAELGGGVEGVAEGDEVILYPGLYCGRCAFCRASEQSLCESFGIIGAARAGTFAEFVAVPAANLLPKPATLSFEQAAALPIAYLTAWRMLITRAELRPGRTVLIHGIGGGVALAALQIAKLAGATAIVTSSSDDKLRRAAALGADGGINYRAAEDVAARVRQLTGGRGVDAAFDSVGAATWPTNFQALRKGGCVVLCGVTSGASAETDLQALYWNQLSVLGSTMGSLSEFAEMLRGVSAGGLEPVIDTVEPLDRAREAAERMERGEQFGKILLRVSQAG